MELLQSVDVTLFHWINVVWAHPGLDWFLPRVADFGPVRVAMVVLAVLLLAFGRISAKAFVIAALLCLLFIDRGVCRWTKYVSHRPRPYQALTDVWRRTPRGAIKTDSRSCAVAFGEPHRSFPSSHAANTMALAFVGWAAWGWR